MSFEGDLSKTGLAKALQRIALQRSTGILTVQGQNDIIAVSFLEGEIVSADALNQTVEDSLGSVLLERELIEPEVLEQILGEEADNLGGLPQALIERDLIPRPQVLDALRIQTYRLMIDLMRWRQGEFKFYPGDEVSFEEGIQAIPVEELLIRSLVEKDPRNEAKLPSLGTPYKQLPAQKPIQVLGRDGDGSSDAIWLTPDEAAIWGRLPSGRSVAMIAQELELDRYKAQYALLRMRQHRLIEAAPAMAVRQPSASAVAEVEIFRPPSPEEMERRRDAAAARAATLPPTHPEMPWPGVALAALATALVVIALLVRPFGLLVPFPWQEGLHRELVDQVRTSLFIKVDRAAGAMHLIDGTFPDDLDAAYESGLLSRSDLVLPDGRSMTYTAGATSYSLALQGDQPGTGYTRSEAGDIHLDSQLLPAEELREAPLFLID